jgi:hypothetical protein
MSGMHCYFIRVNGNTAHNNPSNAPCYVPGEPPRYPQTFFSYIDLCLSNGFIRIGWPATGDLSRGRHVPLRTPCYRPIPTHIRKYLDEFRLITEGSVVLMPDKLRPGTLYIGETTSGYRYSSEMPFECAHRIKVKWDRNNGRPIEYSAADLGISIHGGYWRRAFQILSEERELIRGIDASRRQFR